MGKKCIVLSHNSIVEQYMSHSTHYRSFWGRFYGSDCSTNSDSTEDYG